MIWLTWRRYRRSALIFGVCIALLVAFFVISGLVIYHAYEQQVVGVSVASCERMAQPAQACNGLIEPFLQTYVPLSRYGLAALLALPALAGMFLGAPLVARDLEMGTFRLVWTQSVTRQHWLLTSVALVVGAVTLVCAIFIPLMGWWAAPLGQSADLGGGYYVFEGVIPIAYLLFALALGIAAGALLRHTVPAIFATLVGFIAVRLPIELWARSRFVPPLTATWDPSVSAGSTIGAHDWLLFYGYVNADGQPLYPNVDVYQACAPNGIVDNTPASAFTTCVHAHGWVSLMIWQPASRYWLFQCIESGIFIALALLLIGLTVWWVRVRLS